MLPWGRRHSSALVKGLLALAVTSGCKDIPPARDAIDDVELLGAAGDEADELLEQLATRRTSKFLGFIGGLAFDYEVYDENVLARDLQRVERFYRARGYYEARVRAARVIQIEPQHVRVEIEVHPGQPVVTRKVTILGLEQLPFEVATAAWNAVQVQPDEVFDEEQFEATKQAVVRTLADRSYAFAKIEGKAVVDVARHRADVQFQVQPGPRAEFGPIQIVGLEEIPAEPVLDSIYIREGDPYSLSEIEDAHAALVNLGVFATVDVHEQKDKPGTRRVPVIFRVQEGSLRAIRAGLGVVVDPLRVAARLRLGWQDRNFLGDMRDVAVELQPNVTVFPLNSQRLFNAIGGESLDTCCLLPGNRALIELRRPSLIEARTAGSLRGEYNIYPLLFTGMDPDDAVIRYDEIRVSAGVERAFFHHHFFARPSLNFQINRPSEYQTEFDATPEQPHPATFLDTVQVRYPELVTALDFRDDAIDPRSGVYLGNSLQVAGYVFGGTVSDVRVQPEARAYVPLTRSKKVVLATRFSVGFLFPDNYSDRVEDSWQLRCRPPPNNEPLTDFDFDCPATLDDYNDLRRTIVNDQHKMLFRGFYSGGSTSNRGYGFRDIGPHGPLGILVQSGGVNCFDDASVEECVRPLGGLSLWESSLEVRFPLLGEWRGVTFLDASNVSLRQLYLDFGAPHLSAGFGLRYLTPVGPFRLDLGYRIPGAQDITGNAPLGLRQDSNPDDFLGVPIEVHLSLGEAF